MVYFGVRDMLLITLKHFMMSMLNFLRKYWTVYLKIFVYTLIVNYIKSYFGLNRVNVSKYLFKNDVYLIDSFN